MECKKLVLRENETEYGVHGISAPSNGCRTSSLDLAYLSMEKRKRWRPVTLKGRNLLVSSVSVCHFNCFQQNSPNFGCSTLLKAVAEVKELHDGHSTFPSKHHY